MLAIITLSLALTITPKQCDARPEWCACRQYVAHERNQCEVTADKLEGKERKAALARCEKNARTAARACDEDDGDAYQPEVVVGSDER